MTGEPRDAGDEDGVPTDLTELHETLEWHAALDAEEPDGDPAA